MEFRKWYERILVPAWGKLGLPEFGRVGARQPIRYVGGCSVLPGLVWLGLRPWALGGGHWVEDWRGGGGGALGRGCPFVSLSIQFPWLSSGTDSGLTGGHSYFFFAARPKTRSARERARRKAGAGARPLQTRAFPATTPNRHSVTRPEGGRGKGGSGSRLGKEERKPAN